MRVPMFFVETYRTFLGFLYNKACKDFSTYGTEYFAANSWMQ
jgi:hypothetical protein